MELKMNEDYCGGKNNHHVLIIAEAGVNNNASLEISYKMIDAAKEAGADVIKFQTAVPENVISKYAEKASYQKRSTSAEESQLDMVKRLMLPLEGFEKLKDYCDRRGIAFLSTPFDLTSIDYLMKLNCGQWKIPSGEITNLPYLIKIARTNQPVLLSTGMSTMDEVRAAVSILSENGTPNITLLHCTTEYPAPLEEVNLNAMIKMHEVTGLRYGYSDHTTGIEISIAAAALGASVIEKHFTLDRRMEGPDHKASLEPDEMSAMIKSIRNVEMALGDGIKRPTESERKNIIVARKSIVAATAIKKGEPLTNKNITTKRPGNGISPMKWNEIIGMRAIRDFKADELIEI